MYFNFWFKTDSRQWIFAGDIDAAIKRAMRDGAQRRRISLLECDAVVDHMRLRIGSRNGSSLGRMIHLLTGASARLTLRTAPDIQFDAGVSHFWQKRHGSEPVAPEALSAVRRYMERQGSSKA